MSMESYTLFTKLLKAKDEEEVKIVLEECRLWNNRDFWRPYGDIENNKGTVNSQQDTAIAALIEKPINSLDAVLTKECRLRGIDPKNPEAPQSMQDAVEKFFAVKNGDFFEESKERRKELAKMVRIIAEGDKKEPNIIIADLGEGQVPEKFPYTFCSLHKGEDEKSKIPFVQGQYNMGGSGVLPFCGKYQFQLILSKKYPQLSNGNNAWGFTVVRLHPAMSEDEQLWHEYLVNHNGTNSGNNDSSKNVFTFLKDELDILPYGTEKMTYGTYIKLYNYCLLPSHRSHFGRGFWKEANRILYSPALPILLQETRYQEEKEERLLIGNRTRIRDHKVEEKRESVVEDTEDYSNVKLGIFEDRHVEITVFKEGTHTSGRWGGTDEFTTKEQAIFFTVNGQTHHKLPRSFFRRAKLDYLKDELMVHIDCSSVPVQRRDKIFQSNRTNVFKRKESKAMEEDLLEILKSDEWLRGLNYIREQKSIAHNIKDQKFANKVLSKLVKANPDLSLLLNLGNQVKTGVYKDKKRHQEKPPKPKPKPPPLPPFEGKRFPTFFNVYKWDDEKGIYLKEIPQNSYVRVKFETDVQNDYFNEIRGRERGYFRCSISEIVNSVALRNGIVTVKNEAPINRKVGDTFTARFELTHPYDDSFFQAVEFKVIEPQKIAEKDGRTKDELKRSAPIPVPVYKQTKEGIERSAYKTWEEMIDFEWNEETVSQVKEGDQIVVYINMDSCYLHKFLLHHKGVSDNKRESIIRNYQMAIFLYSVIFRSKIKQKTEECNVDEDNFFQVVMQGVSSIILDLMVDNQKLFD